MRGGGGEGGYDRVLFIRINTCVDTYIDLYVQADLGFESYEFGFEITLHSV